jgi:hypothetical protein
MLVIYCIVHPGEALTSFGCQDEPREALGVRGSPRVYDIIEAPSILRLPGYMAPRWRIATNGPDGVVELISDFQRQAVAPRCSIGLKRGRRLVDDHRPGDEPITAARRNTEGP